MKTETEITASTARPRSITSIADDIRAWDLEHVTDLACMIRDLRNALQGLPIALAKAVDMTALPSMPYPPYAFTYVIWAIDRHGMALVGEAGNEIKSVSSIVSSARYRRAKRSLSGILNWDTEGVEELEEMFAALKATFADPGITVSDVVDPDLVPSAKFPKGMSKTGVWAVDQDEFALIGKEADSIIEVGYLIEAALIAEARRMARKLKT